MGIDWDGLVLKPCMDQFATRITFNPIKSAPGMLPFDRRGVWEVTPITITQEDGSLFITSQFIIGYRLNEMPVRLVKGDTAAVDGELYTLNAFQYDGQGGVRWDVKAAAPGQETHYAQAT